MWSFPSGLFYQHNVSKFHSCNGIYWHFILLRYIHRTIKNRYSNKNMHTKTQSSIIHNNQKEETAQTSISRWTGEQNTKCGINIQWGFKHTSVWDFSGAWFQSVIRMRLWNAQNFIPPNFWMRKWGIRRIGNLMSPNPSYSKIGCVSENVSWADSLACLPPRCPLCKVKLSPHCVHPNLNLQPKSSHVALPSPLSAATGTMGVSLPQ